MAIGTSSDMRWLAVGGSGVQYTAGDGIEIDANNEISAKIDGTSIVVNASGELVAVAGGGSQVQADWTETDPSDPSYIQNKPTIPSATSDLTNDSGFITTSDVPAAQEQADWTESDSSDPAYIKNKPSIPSATSDLTNDSGFITASGVPAAQEQSDWTETDTTDPAYIKHKPTEKSLVAGSNITITEDASNVTISATVPAQEQADWNESDSSDPSYIKNKPTIPSAVTVDQTYNSASTNPQSGTAVAGAIAGVNQVPASTASDEDKVLTVNSNGTPVWATPQGGGTQVQANWTETDPTDPSYIQNKPTIPAAVTVDQTYNSSSSNPQSGTAVAGAIAGVNQVPASTSADENKALIVNSSGNPTWSNTVPLSSDVHAIELVNSLPASPVSGTLYLIPET